MKTEQQNDIRKKLSQCGIDDSSLPMRYLARLESLTENVSEHGDRGDEPSSSPFLSVIMRTQGRRPQMLKDVLLCMQGQTDTDFEILLILHNGDADGKASVEQLLQMQPSSMREKIRYHELSGGTRTAPLNFGLSLATGAYVAFLDDDDLVFDNWVENYRLSAEKKPACVIRAYGCTQLWSVQKSADGTPVLRADSPVENRYCSPFDLTEQLCDNHTPISCVAIPAFCYRALGLRFDEELTTAEDWDFIMRCILTVGVYDTHQLTFVYRLWNGGDSSRTVHQQNEWTANRQRICKKLDEIPILTDRRQLLQLKVQSTNVPIPLSHAKRPVTLRALCKQMLKLVRDWLMLHLKMNKNLRLIEQSPLFDGAWYLENNPDVKNSGADPARHYLLTGWAEGRDPSKGFMTLGYLTRYPDVAAMGICPLLHYERSGRAEGRDIQRPEDTE